MADIAINDVPRKAQYSGNTGLGPFQFTFNVMNEVDIAVYKNSTALDLATDYSVSINLDGTGSITLSGTGNGTAVVSADVITIVGDMALERVTDFTPGGDFQTAAVNEQLDSMVIMLQQLDEKIARSIQGPVHDTITGFTMPTDRKGKVLAFHATTGAVINGPTIDAVVNAEAYAAASAASAAAAQSALNSTLAVYDSFDDRYLGTKSSDPTLDNDGNALLAGALYFNSVAGTMKLYTGSAWVAAYVSGIASNVGFTPVGGIAATNVQTALQELDTEKVAKTSSTGSAVVPASTQANRDASPTAGYFRFNTDLGKFEGYSGSAWGSVGGGATGGGSDEVFVQNGQTMTSNYTIPADKNAMSTGPITINAGVTLTVSSGARYVVI
jgi:hypothetical protein